MAVARLGVVVCVLLGASLGPICGQTTEPTTSLLPTCCNSQLMDSGGYVMIEAGNELTPNLTYVAVVTRICTPFPVRIQKWKPIGNREFELLWEFEIPGQDTVGPAPITYILPTPVMFNEEERIGLFSAETHTVPIPYEFDGNNVEYAFYLSNEKFSGDHVFTPGTTVSLELLRWPRSFRPYLAFCTSVSCTADTLYPATPGLTPRFFVGPQGPPGPAGPPGPPGPFGGFDEIPGPIPCDTPELTNVVINTGNQVGDLQERIQDMQRIIDNIYNSNTVTGLCPLNTMSGDYGLGSCYVISRERLPMGSAEIACRVDYEGHLVKINSEKEERYLRSQIITASSTFPDVDPLLEFWTSGMYSFKGGYAAGGEIEMGPGWYWYHEPTLTDPFSYTNWRTSQQVTPVRGRNQVCMALGVDTFATTSAWDMAFCDTYKFYICEIPKRCL